MSLIIAPGDDGVGTRLKSLLTDVLLVAAQQARDGHPLPPEGPPLTLTTKSIDPEVRATASEGHLLARKLGIFAETVLAVGIYCFGIPIDSFAPNVTRWKWRKNSDFRTFADGLKMTVDLTTIHSNQIETLLVEAAASGICRYSLNLNLLSYPCNVRIGALLGTIIH
jgi:hypothetical protein